MLIQEARELAKKINGVIYKTRFNCFAVATSLWSLAIKIARKPLDYCFYEIVSQKQCTYFDLDLKVCEGNAVPPKLLLDRFEMARQFLKLLGWGYKKYLDITLDLQ